MQSCLSSRAMPSLTTLRALVSEETGFPSGYWMLNLSFLKRSLAQPPAPLWGKGQRKVFAFLLLLYLGSFGLIFLLGILHCLQMVSGAVIVNEFPTPLGDSFLTQSQEREPLDTHFPVAGCRKYQMEKQDYLALLSNFTF